MKKGTCIFFVVIVIIVLISSCNYKVAKRQAAMNKIYQLSYEVSSMQLTQMARLKDLTHNLNAGLLTQEEYDKISYELHVKEKQELIEKANTIQTYKEGESKKYKAVVDAYLIFFSLSYGLTILEDKGETKTGQYYNVKYKKLNSAREVLKKKKEYLKSEGISWEEYSNYNDKQ